MLPKHMHSDSFIKTADQYWKSRLLYTLLLVAGVYAVVLDFVEVSAVHWLFAGWLVAGLSVAVVAFWFLISVKCPRCGARLFLATLGKQERSVTFLQLFQVRECPNCGYAGSGNLDRKSKSSAAA